MAAPRLVGPPAERPVSLAEAKQHLRVEFADEDAVIGACIESAMALYDGRAGVLGRCLINQVWSFTLPGFPACGRIALPFPDVSAVSITYFDAVDALQTLSSSLYRLHAAARRGGVFLFNGAAWPATFARPDAVTVTLTAGFGPAADDVPAMIRQGILAEVSALYHQREGGKAGSFMDRVISQYGRAGIGVHSSR